MCAMVSWVTTSIMYRYLTAVTYVNIAAKLDFLFITTMLMVDGGLYQWDMNHVCNYEWSWSSSMKYTINPGRAFISVFLDRAK